MHRASVYNLLYRTWTQDLPFPSVKSLRSLLKLSQLTFLSLLFLDCSPMIAPFPSDVNSFTKIFNLFTKSITAVQKKATRSRLRRVQHYYIFRRQKASQKEHWQMDAPHINSNGIAYHQRGALYIIRPKTSISRFRASISSSRGKVDARLRRDDIPTLRLG